jgi:hypothetical protein
MAALNAETLLSCWEQGRTRHPLDRALLLHAVAAPELEPESLADLPIGQRNAALLSLRGSLFGDELKSCVDCPQCGEKLEFSLSAGAMSSHSQDIDARELCVDGVRLRLPTTRDLASLASEVDQETAARRLLDRLCVDGKKVRDESALMRALDAADPCLDLAIDLTCPACSHRWSAEFDAPGFLWEEIDVRARTLLDEIHVLAATYGWDEAAILRLSDARRQAYLQRVLA